MDPRKIIRDSVENEDYVVTKHCVIEMDKDGISIGQVEHAMQKGKIVKRYVAKKRYTLKIDDIMICVEIGNSNYVTIITAGSDR